VTIHWPWRRHIADDTELAQARKALEDAHGWATRARRLSTAADRAIIQNHFARDMKEAWQTNEDPR
jgi:hypothetical protein